MTRFLILFIAFLFLHSQISALEKSKKELHTPNMSFGEELAQIQDYLSRLGYYSGNRLGIYGPATRRAINDFLSDFALSKELKRKDILSQLKNVYYRMKERPMDLKKQKHLLLSHEKPRPAVIISRKEWEACQKHLQSLAEKVQISLDVLKITQDIPGENPDKAIRKLKRPVSPEQSLDEFYLSLQNLNQSLLWSIQQCNLLLSYLQDQNYNSGANSSPFQVEGK